MATFDAVLPPFDLSTAVVLVTGGSSGIGLGLVDELIQHGSRVIITGRREAELQKVQAKYGPSSVLKFYVGDAGSERDRVDLFTRVTAEYPELNVLINNAGIQRRGDQTKEIQQPWSARQEEIDINLSGPIHLTSLFIPHLLKHGPTRPSAIINVTSGLAFVPSSHAPIYCCTKAALHQWTLCMRPLLADTNVRLVELIPPAVKSNLGGAHDFGEECDEFCKAMVAEFKAGKLEFGYKFSEAARLADRKSLSEQQKGLNQHLKVVKFQ